ncbi:MAG: M20/M25/M40 family metallo-hydrolase, partial [candidate division WOR-3 bacterium]
MKFAIGVFAFIALISVIHYAHAEPLLVVVELPHRDDIQQWIDMGHPTYEFLNNHAVAEVENELIPDIRSRGFRVAVIDQFPWTEEYFIASDIDRITESVPGRRVWDHENISILKIARDDVPELYRLDHLFQPMRKRVLPARFWEQYLVRKVSLRSLEWDPFIQGLVDDVSTDSITAYIQRLEDFRTRLVLSDSGFASSEWLRQKFNDWGYATRFDSFYIDSSMAAWGVWPGVGFERNIIATSTGTMNPDQLFLIGGHLDAIVWWDTALARVNAPGADDNATGTVAALEAARVFKDYSWESTMEFIGWAAEEIGLYGSYFYADRADSMGLDIGGVINGDMIGYMDDANLDCIIQRKDAPMLWLSELFESVGDVYVPSLLIYPVTSGGGSDWYPFAVNGFAAVGAAERSGSHYNPHYHDTSDVLTTLTPELYTAITRVSVATLAVLGLYPSMVQDVVVLDAGNGTQLRIQWTTNPETDIAGYRVYWGLESEVYTDTHFVTGAGSFYYNMTGLMTDSTYYVTVRAVDTDDHESYVAVEKTGIPRTIPLAPTGVIATPLSSGIRIDWLPNGEIDLAGYRLYRRLDDNPTYD